MDQEWHLNEFRSYLLSHNRAEATIKGYLVDINDFVLWLIQNNADISNLEAVRKNHIEAYCQNVIEIQRHKASTLNRRLSALSAWMSWATQTHFINEDPSEMIHGVAQERVGVRYLDRKEQASLQRAIEKDLQIARLRYPKRWVSRQRDCSLVVFLLHTGLRLNEVLELKLDDLEIGDRKGYVLVRRGRNGKLRALPLNADARKAAQDWLAIRPKEESNFLWIAVENDGEGALSGRSVQRVIRRIGQDAGLQKLTPHILRHTFGKNLVDSGVSLDKVAALMGHSNLNTTRNYVTPNQENLEQAVEKITLKK